MLVVSHINLLHIHVSTYALLAMLEKTVRFLTAVDAVLEQHNNCPPNNKWLGVKYVLIVFG